MITTLQQSVVWRNTVGGGGERGGKLREANSESGKEHSQFIESETCYVIRARAVIAAQQISPFPTYLTEVLVLIIHTCSLLQDNTCSMMIVR